MLKNFVASWIAVAALAASGCCCVDRVYQPYGCGDGCDGAGGMCTDCGAYPRGDWRQRRGRRQLGQRLSCSDGCGDMYWGEWLSHPPDDCDPCNNCGDFVGGRYRYARWWESLGECVPGIWGARYDDGAGCGHGPGCTSCGMEEDGFWEESGSDIFDGQVMDQPLGEPKPALPPGKSGGVENGSEKSTAPRPLAPPSTPKPKAPQPMTDAQASQMRHPVPQPKPLFTQTARMSRPRGKSPSVDDNVLRQPLRR